MDKSHTSFTRELWEEIQTFSILGTWRDSKGIYTLPPSMLNALTDTPLSDSIPVDVLLRLPEWCIYVRTPGMQIDDEILHGFWATVSLDDINHQRSLELLMNLENGLQSESFPLKPETVSAIWEAMFHAGLHSSNAPSEEVNLIKQSEYISALLRRKANHISRLLSVLL